MVGFLHQLPARGGAGARQVAGFEFFYGAHIEQVGGAGRVLLPALQVIERRTLDPGFIGNTTCLLGGELAMVFRGRRKAARLAMGEGLPGQGPADGAVAQGCHRVGEAGVNQRLGANNAAGAPGAIDDNARRRIGRQLTGAQYQLGSRHADAGGDAHGLVFVETARIEHHHIGLAVEQGLDLFGGQGRRVTLVLYQFAKRLAGYIDVDKQLATGPTPTVQPILQQADLGVAQCNQAFGGAVGQPFAVVVQGDLGIAAWNARVHLQFQLGQGDIRGEQRMGLGKGGFLTHVDQRDFFACQQGLANLRKAAGR